MKADFTFVLPGSALLAGGAVASVLFGITSLLTAFSTREIADIARRADKTQITRSLAAQFLADVATPLEIADSKVGSNALTDKSKAEGHLSELRRQFDLTPAALARFEHLRTLTAHHFVSAELLRFTPHDAQASADFFRSNAEPKQLVSLL